MEGGGLAGNMRMRMMRMGVELSFTVIDGERGNGCAPLERRERL